MSKVWVVLLGLLLVGGARAQAVDGANAELLAMASQAAVIFAGHVVAVDRHDAAGFVEVRFRVDAPVRGCAEGATYGVREWAGLWSGNAPRYTVGQRRLMLLTGRGPGGMSSPVGGLDGAIPILPTASEPLADRNGNAPAEDGTEAQAVTAMGVDLRWVEARAARAVVSAPGDGDGGAQESWAGPVGPISHVIRVGTIDAALPTVGTVVAQLKGAK